MTEPIPGPPGLPLLGNINDIDPADSMADLCRLVDTYGPIFKLNLGGSDRVFISTRELLNEVCDDKRFTKMVSGPLEEIRNGVHDGLFTAYPGEHNWEIAHRVLMPVGGKMGKIWPEGEDKCSRGLYEIDSGFNCDVRFSILLDLANASSCAMGTRFNSFYHEGMHPFVDAMVGLLRESAARARRPAVANYLHRSAQLKYDADISLLKKVAAEVVAERRTVPSDKKDLLNAMINGRDPKTGEGLTEESTLNNMITSLIAGMSSAPLLELIQPVPGYETTSGLLSFLFYYLLKNPAAYQTAQRQVDEVVGRGPITVDHMLNFPYIETCLRETLRLRPTAPAFTLQPLPDSPDEYVSLGGKYQIRKGQTIVALLPAIHRDPAVFGSDAEAFRPERMLDEPFSNVPPHYLAHPPIWPTSLNSNTSSLGGNNSILRQLLYKIL
ncbi:hypothetical protein ACEPPN_019357 [Leptodophora sp. 'Broadleaf-Isolate-01']